MNKTLLIVRTEILRHLQKPAFWLALVGVPLFMAILVLVTGGSDDNDRQAIPGLPSPEAIQREVEAGKPQVGFVDQSGLVPAIPASFPAETAALYRQYPDEASARAALAAGEIPGFYIIPADYTGTGLLHHYSPSLSPFGGLFQETLVKILLATSLLDNKDVLYAQRISQPAILLTIEKLSGPAAQPSAREQERESAAFTLGMTFAMFIYISIFMSASLLLQALIEEKENRVIEVLLSSTSPQSILLGKVVGLGLLGLGQVLVWLALAGLLLGGGSQIKAVASIQVPATTWGLALICFILGYLMYASLMAAIGAVANTMRESSQLTVIVVVPIIIPLMFLSALVTQPNGAMARALSWIPLTAPIALVVRSVVTSLPAWEILAGLGSMVAGVALFQLLAARMFRASTLLTGAQPSLRTVLRALRA